MIFGGGGGDPRDPVLERYWNELLVRRNWLAPPLLGCYSTAKNPIPPLLLYPRLLAPGIWCTDESKLAPTFRSWCYHFNVLAATFPARKRPLGLLWLCSTHHHHHHITLLLTTSNYNIKTTKWPRSGLGLLWVETRAMSGLYVYCDCIIFVL